MKYLLNNETTKDEHYYDGNEIYELKRKLFEYFSEVTPLEKVIYLKKLTGSDSVEEHEADSIYMDYLLDDEYDEITDLSLDFPYLKVLVSKVEEDGQILLF